MRHEAVLQVQEVEDTRQVRPVDNIYVKTGHMHSRAPFDTSHCMPEPKIHIYLINSTNVQAIVRATLFVPTIRNAQCAKIYFCYIFLPRFVSLLKQHNTHGQTGGIHPRHGWRARDPARAQSTS